MTYKSVFAYISLFVLAVVLCPASIAGAMVEPTVSPAVQQGGLTCFTIKPVVDSKGWKNNPSCEDLCGKHGAACTGVTNGAMNPPTLCSDPPPPNFAVCRCCRVTP